MGLRVAEDYELDKYLDEMNAGVLKEIRGFSVKGSPGHPEYGNLADIARAMTRVLNCEQISHWRLKKALERYDERRNITPAKRLVMDKKLMDEAELYKKANTINTENADAIDRQLTKPTILNRLSWLEMQVVEILKELGIQEK